MSLAALDVALLVGKAIGVLGFLLFARFLVWLVNLLLVAPRFDPLRHLPGPDGGALESHFNQVNDPDITPQVYKDWTSRFGKTFRYHGYGRHDYRLMSFDLRVLSHILLSPTYQKPWQTRQYLGRLLGRGVFNMEGAEHRYLRKLIGPVFTAQAVKDVSGVYFQKAEELTDRWETLLCAGSGDSATFDVAHWVLRTTFDIFGLAGLDYHFNALLDESEAVYSAFRTMFCISDKSSQLRVLKQLYLPVVERIWPDEADIITQRCLKTIHECGMALIETKRQAILAEKSDFQSQEKDMLSLLIKSNLAADPSARLSDRELLDQITSFLFAGSDTTALAITWCLRYLSLHPNIQQKLREELGDAGTTSQVDVLDGLPYLDAVLRETLRFTPPVHGTLRVATVDDLIPISSPVTLRDGTVVTETEHIRIRKGTFVHIPLEGINMSEDIWGSDAQTFNPDRWLSSSHSGPIQAFPGLANLMSFSFGRAACPGYRFALVEAKVVIAALVRQFSFEPVVGLEIGMYNCVMTKPFVRQAGRCASDGVGLPLKVTRVDTQHRV
ncbi:Cytochrome P450 [Mycena indigotica]|uniref:Cytochrome P450 n=1 Tax=Mycena indigotica TaxID=2126181 RepID=A0A8H6W827_9AGAR|nr:Cytochrome P450 [Mycena indigotica]KAF7306436.1 Cytochrome P450 [Mycena indigotica]